MTLPSFTFILNTISGMKILWGGGGGGGWEAQLFGGKFSTFGGKLPRHRHPFPPPLYAYALCSF